MQGSVPWPASTDNGQGVLQNEAARIHVAVAQAARAAHVLAAVQHPAHDVPRLNVAQGGRMG